MEWKKTIALRAFGLTKIPSLFFLSPTIEKMTPSQCIVKIPLNYRTRNHLKSMYFGVLAAGADCAGALIGMDAIEKSKKPVDLIFKDFTADFHRRAEADVHFTSTDGAAVRKQVAEAIKTGKRINRTVTIVATTPDVSGDTPVATFKLTLSLKLRQPKKATKKPVKKTTREVVKLKPKRKTKARKRKATPKRPLKKAARKTTAKRKSPTRRKASKKKVHRGKVRHR